MQPTLAHAILTSTLRSAFGCLLLATTLASAARAVSVTWNVAGGGDWDTTTANWTGGSTFYTEGDDVTFNNSAGGVINLTANRSPNSTTFSHASGTYTISNNNIVSGPISFTGAGTTVLNSEYATANAITITGGATLRLGASDRIGNGSGFSYGGGGTLDMNGFNETIGGLTGSYNIINMGNLVSLGGDRNGGFMTGSGSFTVNTGGIQYLLRSGGSSTYTGGTFLNNGTLAIYNTTDALPTTGQVTVNSPAVLNLELYSGPYSQTIGALNGSGSVSSSNPSALTVGNGGGSGSFSGVYSGDNTLTKVGAGTQIMSGNNTYIGTTSIDGGILQIDGTTAGQGNYSVNSGGTLGGIGSIGLAGGGNVTVNSGGTLAPGAGPGTLTINGDLILNGGANLEFELGSTSDQVDVNGNLTLDGTLDVTQLSGFFNGTYTLFTYSGTLTDNGLVVVDPNGNYTIDVSQGGQILLLVQGIVPEPSTALLLGLGSLGLAWSTRRRRHPV